MKQIRSFLTILATMLFMSSTVFAQDTAVIVTESGSLGIGTSSPEQKLEVDEGSVRVSNGGQTNALVFRPFIYLNHEGQPDAGADFGGGLIWQKDGENKLEMFYSNADDGLVLWNTQGPRYFFRGDGSMWLSNVSVAPTNGQRGAYFTATTGDFNHAVYNNLSDIDGEGSWDGTKMNVFAGLNVRVGGLPNQQSALFINNVGQVGLGTTTPGHPLEMASGAHVTAGGVWTDASSRAYKDNIEPLTLDAALSALQVLEPVQYNYKADPEDTHLGFIAEDVPDLVASKNRNGMSPMDVVAVLTKVVQQQQQELAALKARLDAHR